MNKLPLQQRGASAIGTIIMLAILGYGVFIGFQYVPQAIESRSIDSILQTVDSANKSGSINSVQAAQERVISLLQVNEMNDMADAFTVTERDGRITVTFSYERELNLLYKIQPMPYKKIMILK
jgi:hypothetical protein